MNESQISLEAQQDAQDQADYIHVPSAILWAIVIILFADFVANLVRPRGLKSNKVRTHRHG